MIRNRILLVSILIAAGTVFSSCFHADRSNPNDWESSKFSYDIHVSVSSGDDLNDGSLTSPVKSVQRAIDLVQPGNTIAVEEGIYVTPSTLAVSGIRIYGGFKSGTDFDPFQRNPWAHACIIRLEGTLTGNAADDPFSTFALTGNSYATLLDGLNIHGPDNTGPGDKNYVSNVTKSGNSDKKL